MWLLHQEQKHGRVMTLQSTHAATTKLWSLFQMAIQILLVSRPWSKDFRARRNSYLILQEVAPGLCFYTQFCDRPGRNEQLNGRKFVLLHPLFPSLLVSAMNKQLLTVKRKHFDPEVKMYKLTWFHSHLPNVIMYLSSSWSWQWGITLVTKAFQVNSTSFPVPKFDSF